MTKIYGKLSKEDIYLYSLLGHDRNKMEAHNSMVDELWRDRHNKRYSKKPDDRQAIDVYIVEQARKEREQLSFLFS